MVQVADRLLGATADRPELADAADLLGRLVDQDVDRDPSGGGGPQVRREVARDRVVSVRDLDVRHGRKSKAQRFDGYKVHLTEEPTSELVTAVAVTPANTPDGQVAATLVGQAAANGAAPRGLVGDLAYGTGDVRAEVAAAGATVVARVPPHANAGRFGKHEFTVDLSDPARPRATCPAGVAATEVRGNGKDRRGRSRPTLFFPTSACGPARCGPAALAAAGHAAWCSTTTSGCCSKPAPPSGPRWCGASCGAGRSSSARSPTSSAMAWVRPAGSGSARSSCKPG
jgi:hypothetical protein